jgi:sterol desaturase/sphingolipid hydroxylase (fatty acid hydroxylase superfamily)
VHHVHHSREQQFTDSNFADMFTVWDRLLGTYREAPDRRAIAYGLAEFDDDRHQTIKGMSLMPLAPTTGNRRDWPQADELQNVART